MYFEKNTIHSLVQTINALATTKKSHSGTNGNSLLVAIDGRCASGKTTLASELKEQLECTVISMDHFFLQPHMRTKERLDTPGGNVDYERFLKEVLEPLSKGNPFSYRPYNCGTGQLDAPIPVTSKPITIIEGSYSCHPALCTYYDYRIFLTTSYEKQLQRIELRNGTDRIMVFREKWIPLEELYFTELDIEKQCNITVTT